MSAKSELIGEICVLRSDIERLRERCKIKDAEIERLRGEVEFLREEQGAIQPQVKDGQ